MASVHTSRNIPLYGSSPIDGPTMLRTGSESPMSSYGDADELMETDKEDEMTDEVDRSFSQTLSVSDGPDTSVSYGQPVVSSSTSDKPASNMARNKRHGMTLPRRLPAMLHGNDDDDPDEDEEVETMGYFGGMGPISPTGGGRTKSRPSIEQSTRLAFDTGKAKPVHSSSRLGQLQRPSMFSMLGKPAPSMGERPQQRAFGRESGRENMLSLSSKPVTQGRSALKNQSRNLEDGFSRGPATAPLRDMSAGLSDGENDDATVKQPTHKARPPMPLFRVEQRPSPKRGDSAPVLGDKEATSARLSVKRNAKSFADDFCMDLDSPSRPQSSRTRSSMESPKSSSTPLAVSPGLGEFFGSDASPNANHVAMRTQEDAFMGSGTESSPGSVIDSPSNPRTNGAAPRVFEKSFSSGGMGVGSFYGNRVSTNLASRRREPYNKRPLLIATNTAHEIPTHTATASALPVMDGKSGQPAAIFSLARAARPAGQPLMRRAHSVCDQSDPMERAAHDQTQNTSSGMMSNTGRVVSHIETGTTGLQAIHHLGGRITPDNFGSSGDGAGQRAPFAQAGLLGFGANEMEGKVLPCHSVKEDGLVRVTKETVCELIEGKYSGHISRYHIIDCRFGYEYEGGHIDGSLNVNSNAAVEELLLQDGFGVHADGYSLPKPSRSGEPLQDSLPAILIFHCEFSNKRAPAFAKHFRSKDRSLNQQDYPKVHFPELYILEGGYCDFFKRCPEKCEPQAYVPMDDPKHCERRDNNLHDFRKFTRTRSFTYGEPQPPVRPAQPCQPLAFLPSNGVLNRRVTSVMEEEDIHMMSPANPVGRKSMLEWDSPGNDSIDGSPCARYLHNPRPEQSNRRLDEPIFGSIKSRVTGGRALGTTQGKRNFNRTASYAGPS